MQKINNYTVYTREFNSTMTIASCDVCLWRPRPSSSPPLITTYSGGADNRTACIPLPSLPPTHDAAARRLR